MSHVRIVFLECTFDIEFFIFGFVNSKFYLSNNVNKIKKGFLNYQI